jgi:UDP-N-acetylenolpyruvoylglucosamine reductase
MGIGELVALGRDRVQEHAAFGERTTYRVGGSVAALVTLSTMDDLEELGPLIYGCGLDVVVLGNGSNLLVADGERRSPDRRVHGSFLAR